MTLTLLPAIMTIEEDQLYNISTEINNTFRDTEFQFKLGFDGICKIGDLLVDAKRIVKRSGMKWGEWIEENLDITRQQVNKYMRVSERKRDILEMETAVSISNISLVCALKHLSDTDKKAKFNDVQEYRSEIANKATSIPQSDKWNIYHGDIAIWNSPRKYDFIITDPPYPKQFLPLYEILAMRANEFLNPGGLLVVMCGQSYIDQIYQLLSRHLNYYWTACYMLPGQPTPLRTRQVNTTWKPVLIYSMDKNYKGKIFGDVFISDGNDKEYHKWGQSVGGMTSLVKQICLPGQSIFDPFCGAGTTGIASINNGCLFDGLDIDIDNVNISKARLTENDG